MAATSAENAETHDSTDDYDYDEADVVEISLGATIAQIPTPSSSTGPRRPSPPPAPTHHRNATDGQIIVDAGDGAMVQLILDDADITNADGAAIAVMSAETAIVILADGSSNTSDRR